MLSEFTPVLGTQLTTATKVLVIDDHPLFREALEVALIKSGIFPSNIYSCNSIAQSLALIKKAEFDLVLLDLTLSDSHGFEGFAKIRAAGKNIPIIVVSATESSQAFSTAKSLGASGYIPKSSSLDNLTQTIGMILDGQTSFPATTPHTIAKTEASAKLASLTPAQHRVMTCLSDGLLNKQIAFEMSLSEATVKAHMTAIFTKFGVSNRTQALMIFRDATRI